MLSLFKRCKLPLAPLLHQSYGYHQLGKYATQQTNGIFLPRRHRRLYGLVLRELSEERLRDFLPPKPIVPNGWELEHHPGSNRFDLRKTVEVEGGSKEDLHVVSLMELKEYEGTYRMDNGEREEQEYLYFTLFIRKHRYQGALEFGLTSIDMELVLDSLVVHCSTEELNEAVGAIGVNIARDASKNICTRTTAWSRRRRDGRYRGPMLNELDDDLADEISDYLDERGVNDGFAEYMMSQAHFFEQQEYLNWLNLLGEFAQ
ncbi:putative Mitochondrial glycoprotein [Trypanosoma vivax]|uniref:Putative p22 protein n=1 Tax=Trypanosoma vivax (strain Y486) TaxID=1055687 RepID=G0TYF5_TRYVY|nr:putative p22 protein precursor [Trypanosoma vivax]KAH8619742.1 putative Mitochondrial glycoprotein [Trypanosoma vivax]CCC49002.1 putative p22 protein precursor [Trypanosoma vivax Y486]